MDSLTEMITQAEADVREREALADTADSRVTAAQADAAAAHESLNEARIVLAWLLRRSEDRPGTASLPESERPFAGAACDAVREARTGEVQAGLVPGGAGRSWRDREQQGDQRPRGTGRRP